MTDQSQPFGTLLERPSATRNAKAGRASPREQSPPTKLPSLRERTRADNRDRYRRSPTGPFAREFRCECARPDCAVRLPLDVERHRRRSDRFIVGPAHAYGDTLVGVADDFLVVEANGMTRSQPDAVHPVVSLRSLQGVAAPVRDESRPTLIFFTREQSGPARRMESLLAHVALKERDRLRVRRVDVTNQGRLVRKFGVEQVPCLVLVVERKVAGRIDGRANLTQIKLLLERHLAESVAGPDLTAA